MVKSRDCLIKVARVQKALRVVYLGFPVSDLVEIVTVCLARILPTVLRKEPFAADFERPFPLGSIKIARCSKGTALSRGKHRASRIKRPALNAGLV
ncbi:MAG: hypothetical protein ACR2MZ_08340 [Candidatus Dormibacter sp.]|uniref:hypothetical protein n=1 Tax=Candidatus Dormibacter sp. TaxID=2973982 RepID=UPI000DB3AC9A|nr:MAG: hypothetical protein DLM66_13930 [Candidatus Dormibacteraeota bacterium]